MKLLPALIAIAATPRAQLADLERQAHAGTPVLSELVVYMGDAPMPLAKDAWLIAKKHRVDLLAAIHDVNTLLKAPEKDHNKVLQQLRKAIDEIQANGILDLPDRGRAGHPLLIIRVLRQGTHADRVREISHTLDALFPLAPLAHDRIVVGWSAYANNAEEAAAHWIARNYREAAISALPLKFKGGRANLTAALGPDPDKHLEKTLIGLIKDEDWAVRRMAMQRLAKVDGFDVGDAIRSNLWHKSADTRAAALQSLFARRDPTARKRIIAMLDDPIEEVQRQAANALTLPELNALPVLRHRKFTGRPFPDFMEEALRYLYSHQR